MAILQRRGLRAPAKRWRFAAIAGALLLAGCGGGGGGGGTTPPPPATTVTVTGTVVNQANQAKIANASVTYAGKTVKTNTSGVFSIVATVPVTAQAIKITATGYYARGYYTPAGSSTRQSINFQVDGIPVAAQVVGLATPINVGKVELFVSTGPPPPPPL